MKCAWRLGAVHILGLMRSIALQDVKLLVIVSCNNVPCSNRRRQHVHTKYAWRLGAVHILGIIGHTALQDVKLLVIVSC